MNRFWNKIILPIIESIEASYIIEVGSDTGVNTRNILEYCNANDAHMTAIDPFPSFDIDEFKTEYGDKFEIYTELSLKVLPLLKDYDAILLDGDHNWYTLYNELKIIEETFKNKKFPIVFLHDISWPYARRDLYYNPEDIPINYRHPYQKLGMYPGQADLKEKGGLNSHFFNAICEKNPCNGVLTGIEDFINETKIDFSFEFVNAYYGLGILFPKDETITKIVKKSIENSKLLDNLEEERVKLIIAYNESKDENKSLISKLDLKQKNYNKQVDLNNQLYQNLEKAEKRAENAENEANIHLKSIRYQIGDIFVKALHPSKHTVLWPIELIKLLYNKNRTPTVNNKNSNKLSSKINKVEFRQYSNNQINNILRAFDPDKKISIIIPIYNAFEDTTKCLNSVLEKTKIPYELILIDDCSTDTRIGTLLNEMEKFNHVKVIRNSENKGFVKNVNIGIQNSEGDILLLNSDTIVTTRWLQKLLVAAYSNEKIGTVTPFSNSAGAFSVPEIGKENKIPTFLTVEGMASLVEKVSHNANIEVPTGNGFCLFIKRSVINDVGLFDEENFGRGYGEENDFCMRAINKSWKNIIDDSTFIYHKRSASFSNEKEELIKQNRSILDKKHPSYTKMVSEFVSSDKLREIRENIGLEIKNADFNKIKDLNKKRILYVLHHGEGGTPNTNKDLMQHIQNNFECYVLTSTAKELMLWKYEVDTLEKIRSWEIKSHWSAQKFYNDEFRDIYFNVLTGLEIDIVHIRHLFKHTFDLPVLAKKLGLPTILSFHDFYFVCPSIHLLDQNNEYCAGKCTEGILQCQIPGDLLNDIPILKNFVDKWRIEVSKILENCSTFITTSEVAKQIHLSTYPQLKNKKFKVIEHGRDFNIDSYAKYATPSKEETIRILIPGNIDNHKGSEFIKELKNEDKENRLEFHFMGNIIPELNEYGICHGKYERNDFCKIVNNIRPSFIGIFSIWPETYCHTLSEAWACGIPVLATKIGVLEERVIKNGGGWLLDHHSASKSYKEILRIINSPDEYIRIIKEINDINFKSTKEMAFEYEYTYWQNLKHSNTIPRVGIFVHGRNKNFPPTTHIRLLLPFYHPNLYGKVVPYIADEDETDKIIKNSFLSDFDCIIVQRDILDETLSRVLVQKCREDNIKLIYEIDDDLLNIDKTHPEYNKYLDKSASIEYLVENADMVTVSTNYLKEKFEIKNNVKLISNALDERLWCNKANISPPKEDNLKIGYMGSFTHEKDLTILKEVIQDLKMNFKNNIELDIIGGMEKKDEESWFNQKEIPSNKKNYPEFVKWLKETVDWDIAIAPLAESNINNSKSEIKYLEYTGLGLAAVYSDIGPYKESIENEYNGLLVKNNDPKKWEEQIVRLIQDNDLLDKIKSNSKQNVEENYLVKHRTEQWYNVINELVGSVKKNN